MKTRGEAASDLKGEPCSELRVKRGKLYSTAAGADSSKWGCFSRHRISQQFVPLLYFTD